MLCENFAYPDLMGYFEKISSIPRRSYHEEKIADYLVGFAKERGLEYFCDEIGNVLINLPASSGYDAHEPILLQGHTDMVCEKNEGVEHDFDKEPLKLYEKDGWIRACGTTLGADDGVAVAVMLAILDGAAEKHPAIQCLFTVSEEVGLDGAKAFDYSKIYARKMINMDSPDENSIIVGCAGGLRSSLKIPVTYTESDMSCIKLRVGGLYGGHSGEDINKGRANANKLLGRIMFGLSKKLDSFLIVSLNGGSKDNAIPREAEAVVCVSDVVLAKDVINKISEEIKAELCRDDRNFFITVTDLPKSKKAFDKDTTDKILLLISTVANGVFAMNNELSSLVEYSRNLGVLTTDEDAVEFVFSSRSARDSQIDLSVSELDAYASFLGAYVKHYNRYPGWTFAQTSDIRDQYISAYSKLFGREPRLEVIHAGLECGIIKEAVPDMDMLSCGPIVLDLHSPDEALNKKSFERFFSVILETLKI